MAIPEEVKPEEENASEFIQVPKIEYEEIKNRVLAIEKRLSVEYDSVFIQTKADTVDGAEDVQNAYQKTLEEVEALTSPTTDQLAKRLSRELKIRRSDEFKVIRSPSARKIGILRRRSRESERNGLGASRDSVSDCSPKKNLKRGQPNTILSGLPAQSPFSVPPQQSDRRITRSLTDITTSDFNSPSKWSSADGFFQTSRTPTLNDSYDGRASLVKLRSQNAGMVLAKAKLFDGLLDENGKPRAQPQRKIGSQRNHETRMRMLRNEDRRLSKKNSPKRRQRRMHAVGRSFDALSPDFLDCKNKENDFPMLSPKPCKTPIAAMPPIRKQLSVKSPKRIMRTPLAAEFKGTPLRALGNRNNNFTSPHF